MGYAYFSIKDIENLYNLDIKTTFRFGHDPVGGKQLQQLDHESTVEAGISHQDINYLVDLFKPAAICHIYSRHVLKCAAYIPPWIIKSN